MLGASLLLVVANAIGLLEDLPAVSPPANFQRIYTLESTPSSVRRVTYNYSVIPGGAFSAQELKRALSRDPVAGQHYKDLDPSTMRPVVLTADRYAHVSYRVGERVFWTAKRVRIRSGETILSNGQTEIRARCGNCISMEPLMPTSEEEPAPMELDALTDTGPVLVSWPLNAFAPVADGGPLSEGSAPIAPPQLGGLVPLGVSAFPVDTIVGGPFAEAPGGSILGGAPPPTGTTTPRGTAPLFIAPTVPQFVIDDPSEFDPLDPLFEDDPSSPPTLSSTPPVNVTPVPEPGTFLLLGGGIACLISRYRSIRNRV
jgi:hypothetical protein